MITSPEIVVYYGYRKKRKKGIKRERGRMIEQRNCLSTINSVLGDKVNAFVLL